MQRDMYPHVSAWLLNSGGSSPTVCFRHRLCQPLRVLDDVTPIGSAAQNDGALYASFGSDHNSSAFSSKTAPQRDRCQFGWHKRSSYRAQMSQCSFSNPYILYHWTVKHSCSHYLKSKIVCGINDCLIQPYPDPKKETSALLFCLKRLYNWSRYW